MKIQRMKMDGAVCLLVICFIAAVRDTNAAYSHPNVLFLVVDDLRPKLKCYGEINMVTPNIDNLAMKSVLFQRAYTQQALCSPSRTSFLTGRRPDTTHVFDLDTYFRKLSGNFTTLPQHFKNNGYITWSCGKIFHPGESASGNDDNAYSWTYPAYHSVLEQHRDSKACPSSDGKLHDNAYCPVNLDNMLEKSLEDIQNTDVAMAFLHNRSLDGEPFFLGLGLHKPHLPFRFPEEFLKLYPLSKIHLASSPYYPPWLPPVAYSPWDELRRYDDIVTLNLTRPLEPVPNHYQILLSQAYSAATSYTDGQVGRILQALDQYGLANNTIVTFHGDHGWQLGEHDEWCKHTNFDIATRIPLMLHVPGVTSKTSPRGEAFPFFNALASTRTVKQKTSPCVSPMCSEENGPSPNYQTTDALVEAVDLYTTLSELTGLDVPPTCPPNPFKIAFCTEGSSLVPVIKNVTRARFNGYDVTERMSFGETFKWKSAVFSQFPRPADSIQKNSESPALKDIRIMGYTMMTDRYRYTEWVAYDPKTFTADFSHLYARELYDHVNDPEENLNVVNQTGFRGLADQLAKQLRGGWREALPKH